MTDWIADASPRSKARVAGLFEALEGLTSASGQVLILGRLVVRGNAAATAAGILGHERLFWFGFALSLVAVLFHIGWTLLFHDVMKVVNRSVSALAVSVMLVGCALQASTALLYLAPWLVLDAGTAVSGMTPDQLHALAYVFVRLNAYSFNVYLVFFGAWCTLNGYLIFRSTFLPRILGILLAIDGVGWMLYVSPAFAVTLFPVIATASALAEIPLQFWLLVFGVNDRRWREQAASAGAAPAEFPIW